MHPVVRLLLFRIELAILSASDPSPFKSESTTLCSGNLIDPLLIYFLHPPTAEKPLLGGRDLFGGSVGLAQTRPD